MAVSKIIDRDTTVGPTRLRVVTHNIYGRNANWEDRRRALIAGIRELTPDLASFQESVLTNDYDQPRDLLGAEFEIVHSAARETNGSGIAIASRWPITQVRELDLNVTPRTGDFACTTLIAEITAPDPFGPVLLVNHFPDYQVDHEYERELQTVLAVRVIEAMVRERERELHVILAGDLDAELDAASVRFLIGKQSLDGLSVCYRDAWDSVHPNEPGHTYSTHSPLHAMHNWDWPYQQIDHILVRCGFRGQPTLQIAACELAFAEPVGDVWASDHFGLVADLVLPRPALETGGQTSSNG